jgi:hypothetical protein
MNTEFESQPLKRFDGLSAALWFVDVRFCPSGLVVDFDGLQPPGVGYQYTSSPTLLIAANLAVSVEPHACQQTSNARAGQMPNGAFDRE